MSVRRQAEEILRLFEKDRYAVIVVMLSQMTQNLCATGILAMTIKKLMMSYAVTQGRNNTIKNGSRSSRCYSYALSIRISINIAVQSVSSMLATGGFATVMLLAPVVGVVAFSCSAMAVSSSLIRSLSGGYNSRVAAMISPLTSIAIHGGKVHFNSMSIP